MIRLAVRCRPDQAELVLAELAVLAPGGVEERLLHTETEDANGGSVTELVEYAIYGADGELPDLGEIEVALGDGLVEVESTEVADDWADRWREFHNPILVGERIWVRPPWREPYRPGNGDGVDSRPVDGGAAPSSSADRDDVIDVAVDPGQAFGTGAHQTTRLCLEAILDYVARAQDGSGQETIGAFADFGTGSGVLAIAAAKLGFYPVWAYDHDPVAVTAARENAVANGVQINVARVDLRVGIPPLAPLTVANLVAPMLIDIAGRLEPDDRSVTLVCSGILPEQLDDVAAAFAPTGLTEAGRATDTAWSALILERG